MMGKTADIDLTPFCGEAGGRYAMDKPWVAGGWRYATDGRIIVRVPTPDEPDTTAERLVPNAGGWFFGPEKYKVEACTAQFPPHDGKTRTIRCREDHQPECSACNGTGECECPDCMFEHPCRVCDGTGENPEYEAPDKCVCEGTGQLLLPALMDVGGKSIDGRYLVRIAGLPNARYDPDGASDQALCFRADGGIEGRVGAIRRNDGN